MAVPNISEIITTTAQWRSKQLADNVSDNNALLKRLKERGKQKTVDGGNVIYQELDFTDNTTFKWYSGGELLDITPQEVMSSSEWAWKQAALSIQATGLEAEVINSGREKMIDLVDARMTNAERSFANAMSVGIYSDGTASGGKQIGGLNLLVSATPTSGIVGGIDRATWTFWRNFLYDFSVEGVTAGATTIQHAMNLTWLGTSRGSDHVDLIVADNNYYTFYWESLQAIQRIMRDGQGVAGFDSLAFKSADVVFDGGIDGACPANTMFFLNTDFLFYRPHVSRNMVPLSPRRFSTNQDAYVELIGWAGNMTMSNARLQGRIQA